MGILEDTEEFMNTLMFPLGFVLVVAGILLKVIPYEYMFILSAILSALGAYFATRLADVHDHNSIKA